MAVRIQFRRGTETQWNGANPVLLIGEVGFNTTTKQIKVGDGTNTWSNLPYFASGTITEINTGAGLTGGGNSGSVTLSLATEVLTEQNLTAKGDLITASAPETPTVLAVGDTNGDVLQVSSSAPTGLAYGKVQTSAIASGAVTDEKILDGAVTAGKILTGAVTSTKLQTNAVTEDKIAPGAVNTNQIANLAVTGDKFADNTITSAKIANNTIVNEDINTSANISFSKLETGTLPATIKTTTSNYIDNSITVAKLSNTVGPTGVGVWQDWTPSVSGVTSAQWAPLYCKYMKLNNTCIVYAIIKLQSLPVASGRKIKVSLPLEPAFMAALPSTAAVAVGNVVHWGQNQTTKDDTSYYGVYRNGFVEHWRHGGEDSLAVTGTDGIISVYATYPVA